jgi:hypothetical protein
VAAPHHTWSHYISGSFRQPRKLIFGMQPYFDSTRRNMEENLNIFFNGRQTHLKKNGKWLQIFAKRKTVSMFLKIEVYLFLGGGTPPQ